jgi:hypothetical protein
MSDKDSQGGYVRKVRNDTRKYIQDLLNENERLQVLVSSLQDEQTHTVGSLRKQVELLRQELEHNKNEESRLKKHLAETQAENRRFFEQYAEVEQENSNLANLYVASYRLHGTLDRRQVLDVIQEIVINLIGSEEIGIFEMEEDGASLRLISSFGIDSEDLNQVPLGRGPIGTSAQTGEVAIWSRADAPPEQRLTACVPLKLDGRVLGVIAIFGLLPQKPDLGPLDRELFDLLATHAATALYCTGLHAKINSLAGSIA